MAWSDAARRAAAEARKRNRKNLYSPVGAGRGVHHGRGDMAKMLVEARSIGMRGPGQSERAVKYATTNQFSGKRERFTNVKGAHFVDQGLGGKVWRSKSGKRGYKGGVPKWAAKQIGIMK